MVMHVAAAKIATNRGLRVRMMKVEMKAVVYEIADEKSAEHRQSDYDPKPSRKIANATIMIGMLIIGGITRRNGSLGCL